MKQIINGADFRRMIINAAAAIETNKQALNELNVFPVPDGDTGTNMSMTIHAAAADLRKTEDPDLGKAAGVAASIRGVPACVYRFRGERESVCTQPEDRPSSTFRR